MKLCPLMEATDAFFLVLIERITPNTRAMNTRLPVEEELHAGGEMKSGKRETTHPKAPSLFFYLRK